MIMDIIILILLELLVGLGYINPIILPKPSTILFKSDIIDILIALKDTLSFTIFLFLISLIIDLVLIIIIYYFNIKYLENLLYRINTIPKIIIMLLGIAIMGVGYKTIGIMSIISTMPNFIITVLGYLKNSNNENLILAAKDLNASKFTIIYKVLIPANSKGIIISIKILFSSVYNSIIMGEYLIGTNGLGSCLQNNLFMYNMKNVWMITLIICLICILISKIFDFVLNSRKMWFNHV